MATTGDSRAGTMILSTTPLPWTAPGPWANNAAPTMPPRRACDELDGRPTYQVAMFHVIAPIRPEKTVSVVTASASTSPVATVVATCSEMNAPTKLSTDAPATATRGGMARVEIVV